MSYPPDRNPTTIGEIAASLAIATPLAVVLIYLGKDSFNAIGLTGCAGLTIFGIGFLAPAYFKHRSRSIH